MNTNINEYTERLREEITKGLNKGFNYVVLKPRIKDPFGDENGRIEIRTSDDYDRITKKYAWFNIGIICQEYEPGYLIVIDVDNKHGKNGFKFLEENNINLDELNTYTEVSPNNGKHYYFYSPLEVNTIHYDCGIDVLGIPAGGSQIPNYCVCYPSIALNEESNKYEMYNIVNNAEIQEAGEEIYNLLYLLEKQCGSSSKKPQITNNSDGDQVIPCGTRDDTLFHYALMFMNNGFNQQNTYNLLSIINTNMCEVPLSDSIVKQKVKSAFNYEPNPVNYNIKEKSNILTAQDLINASSDFTNINKTGIDWLIKGWIPKDTITFISGDGGVGKTTLVFSLIGDITRGRPTILEEYEDEPRMPLKVAYLSIENLDGTIANKLETFNINRDYYRGFMATREDDTGNIKGSVLLGLYLDNIQAIKGYIESESLDLIIFDPFQTFFPPDKNMNSRSDMRNVLDGITSLAATTHTAIIFISHTNKSLKSSGRSRIGESSDIYDCSRMIYILGETYDHHYYLSNEKNNLGPRNKTIIYDIGDTGKLMLKETSDKRDYDFMKEKSSYFKKQSDEEKEEHALTQIDRTCKLVLGIIESNETKCLRSSELRDFIQGLHPDISDKTISRACSRLIAKGEIEKVKGKDLGLKRNDCLYRLKEPDDMQF